MMIKVVVKKGSTVIGQKYGADTTVEVDAEEARQMIEQGVARRYDWADEMADETACSIGCLNVIEEAPRHLIAAQLRLARELGAQDGIDKAFSAMETIFNQHAPPGARRFGEKKEN